ncbi:hypothetical protein BC939DRAFT_450626 [Gamsiella multidivaricata]|uniref:uncharacterized protein n=1 Tax=Gamsiella multidivaricata TaxID=101098 RepID=UPI00221FCCE4|nr:uncharacterized protein BC939DRAFT_450626 [Gamsiella multidivaricata]KAI7824118.1 hypothetical protein BC939DRAFT_450626 [Gamsiella multidivaricata]
MTTIADMQTTFTKFSHTVVNRVSDKSIFSLQYKLCCLLLNIKRMVALRNITTELHHSFWIQDDFDFPDGEDSAKGIQVTAPSFKVKVNDAKSIYRLQEKFLHLAISGHDTDQEMDNDDGQDYGFDASQSTWEATSQFNDQRILEYWNSLRVF